jgi:phage-related protein
MSDAKWEFLRYKDKNGDDPVWGFLKGQITDGEKGQISARMQTVKEYGTHVSGNILENLGENLYMLRVPNTPNNPRIFMCTLSSYWPRCLVMLHAYRKKDKKIPEAEMKIARKRLEEVQSQPEQHVF